MYKKLAVFLELNLICAFVNFSLLILYRIRRLKCNYNSDEAKLIWQGDVFLRPGFSIYGVPSRRGPFPAARQPLLMTDVYHGSFYRGPGPIRPWPAPL